jgi:hypothetical protein
MWWQLDWRIASQLFRGLRNVGASNVRWVQVGIKHSQSWRLGAIRANWLWIEAQWCFSNTYMYMHLQLMTGFGLHEPRRLPIHLVLSNIWVSPDGCRHYFRTLFSRLAGLGFCVFGKKTQVVAHEWNGFFYRCTKRAFFDLQGKGCKALGHPTLAKWQISVITIIPTTQTHNLMRADRFPNDQAVNWTIPRNTSRTQGYLRKPHQPFMQNVSRVFD